MLCYLVWDKRRCREQSQTSRRKVDALRTAKMLARCYGKQRSIESGDVSFKRWMNESFNGVTEDGRGMQGNVFESERDGLLIQVG